MKRKRDIWDNGESYHLLNTEEKDLSCSVSAQDMGDLQLMPSSKVPSVPDCIQRKRAVFYIQKDKRHAEDVVRKDPTSIIVRDMHLFLPDFLRESLWKRHEYSLDDVISTLEACPKAYIWQLALFYNIQILNSASKPSWSSSSIIYGGKSSAISRMKAAFEKSSCPFSTWKQRPSTLLKCSAYLKQPLHLPFHWVTPQTMDLLCTLLPEEKPVSMTAGYEEWLGQPVRQYKQYVTWVSRQGQEQVHLVPLAVYKTLSTYNFILLNRIAPYDAYCKMYRQNTPETSLSEWLDVVDVADQRYALLDEAFYVVSRR